MMPGDKPHSIAEVISFQFSSASAGYTLPGIFPVLVLGRPVLPILSATLPLISGVGVKVPSGTFSPQI